MDPPSLRSKFPTVGLGASRERASPAFGFSAVPRFRRSNHKSDVGFSWFFFNLSSKSRLFKGLRALSVGKKNCTLLVEVTQSGLVKHPVPRPIAHSLVTRIVVGILIFSKEFRVNIRQAPVLPIARGCVTCSASGRDMVMASTAAARVRKRRAALREAGLRPVQIWVPDTRRPGFAEECRRQSLLAAASDLADEGLAAFLDEALGGIEGWTGQ